MCIVEYAAALLRPSRRHREKVPTGWSVAIPACLPISRSNAETRDEAGMTVGEHVEQKNECS